jgi:hypothetical protein
MKSLLAKLGVIIMAFIVVGCASSQTSVPVMPKYDNQAEKGCAKLC